MAAPVRARSSGLRSITTLVTIPGATVTRRKAREACAAGGVRAQRLVQVDLHDLVAGRVPVLTTGTVIGHVLVAPSTAVMRPCSNV